jgi:hypothetical protein
MTRLLSRAAIAAQLLFIGAFLVVGATEGHGYDAMRHDISDLGALTAHHAGVFRLLVGLAGAVTIAFGLLVVRPALRSTAAGVLAALSLPGFDNLTDTFFRLDCRAADAGCSASVALSSWHAKLHIVCFVIAATATVAAAFVIGNRTVGWVTIALLVVSGASSGSAVQGLTQRIAATVVPLGVAVLAWRLSEPSTDLVGADQPVLRRP